MVAPPAFLGLDVGEVVEDAVRALVDLVVPDLGADWVSQLVVWLVALPPVTGEAFPALNRYAEQLTAVGFGLLGACFIGGLLQIWAAGLTGVRGAGESLQRTAVAAGALVAYPALLQAAMVGTNVLTAQMVRHPLVVDGLDKAFGGALVVAAITGGLSLGLAVGAAVVVLYFIAALIVMKIGLTTALAVAHVAGALVWGLHPLPQATWLARAWTGVLVAALLIPVAWACVFAAAALLAQDTLVFEGGGQYNAVLGEALQYLVKPLAAVACFWLAYRAPGFLIGLARSAGLSSTMLAGTPLIGDAGQHRRKGPEAISRAAVRTNADRFRALGHLARQAAGRQASPSLKGLPKAPARTPVPSHGPEAVPGLRTLARANRWWRELPAQGRQLSRNRSGQRRQAVSGRGTPPRPQHQRARPAKTSRSAATAPGPPAPPTSAPAARTSRIPVVRLSPTDSPGKPPRDRRPNADTASRVGAASSTVRTAVPSSAATSRRVPPATRTSNTTPPAQASRPAPTAASLSSPPAGADAPHARPPTPPASGTQPTVARPPQPSGPRRSAQPPRPAPNSGLAGRPNPARTEPSSQRPERASRPPHPAPPEPNPDRRP